jgi:hypothetical protein
MHTSITHLSFSITIYIICMYRQDK